MLFVIVYYCGFFSYGLAIGFVASICMNSTLHICKVLFLSFAVVCPLSLSLAFHLSELHGNFCSFVVRTTLDRALHMSQKKKNNIVRGEKYHRKKVQYNKHQRMGSCTVAMCVRQSHMFINISIQMVARVFVLQKRCVWCAGAPKMVTHLMKWIKYQNSQRIHTYTSRHEHHTHSFDSALQEMPHKKSFEWSIYFQKWKIRSSVEIFKIEIKFFIIHY